MPCHIILIRLHRQSLIAVQPHILSFIFRECLLHVASLVVDVGFGVDIGILCGIVGPADKLTDRSGQEQLEEVARQADKYRHIVCVEKRGDKTFEPSGFSSISALSPVEGLQSPDSVSFPLPYDS